MTSQIAIPALCKTIKVLVEKGDHATDKAEQFYISAGKHLVELKERCPGDWHDKIGIGRSRAYEYMALADGRKSLSDLRVETKGKNDRRQERIRSVLHGQQTAISIQPSEQEEEDEDVEAEVNPRNLVTAFLLRADQARQFAVFSGKATKETIVAAKTTAAAWGALVKKMEKGK